MNRVNSSQIENRSPERKDSHLSLRASAVQRNTTRSLRDTMNVYEVYLQTGPGNLKDPND